jgi:hypothetical protein
VSYRLFFIDIKEEIMHLIIIQRKKKEKISKIPEKTIKKLEIENKRKREQTMAKEKKEGEKKSERDIKILKKLRHEEQLFISFQNLQMITLLIVMITDNFFSNRLSNQRLEVLKLI